MMQCIVTAAIIRAMRVFYRQAELSKIFRHKVVILQIAKYLQMLLKFNTWSEQHFIKDYYTAQN